MDALKGRNYENRRHHLWRVSRSFRLAGVDGHRLFGSAGAGGTGNDDARRDSRFATSRG